MTRQDKRNSLRFSLWVDGRTTRGQPVPVIASTRMWVSDDPERDWETILAPALAYQAEVYAQMGTDVGQPPPPQIDPHTLQRTSLLIDTPEHVVNMIRQMQTIAPLTEGDLLLVPSAWRLP